MNDVYAFKFLEEGPQSSSIIGSVTAEEYFCGTPDGVERERESEWLSFGDYHRMLKVFGSADEANLDTYFAKSLPIPDTDGAQHLNFFRHTLLPGKQKASVEEFVCAIKDTNGFIGMISGFAALGEDMTEFFQAYSKCFASTLVNRSWRMALRYMCEGKAISALCDRANQEIPEHLQDDLVERILACLEKEGRLTPYLLLVNDIYVSRNERGCGVFRDMMRGLEFFYGADYSGVFYLTPKRDETNKTAVMRLMSDYSALDYDIDFNIDMMRHYGMEIIGEERPLAFFGKMFLAA